MQSSLHRQPHRHQSTLPRPVQPIKPRHFQHHHSQVICGVSAAPNLQQPQQPYSPSEADDQPSTSPQVSQYVREAPQTYSRPSIRGTGTLRPGAEWYPAWMKYRRREDNYVFWQDQFVRCSLDVPWYEKRWTVFSTLWYIVMETRFTAVPPALRFLWHLLSRSVMFKVYEAHKAIVLWQCKVDAYLANIGSKGAVRTISKTMALRRLHWKNGLLAEALYWINLYKTGRVFMLPPEKKPQLRPTFFYLF